LRSRLQNEESAVMDADHPHSPQHLSDEINAIREIIRQSLKVLRDNPSPTIFLGRKTQEPFAEEIER
jgi:transcriptional regulator of NAD metabolism